MVCTIPQNNERLFSQSKEKRNDKNVDANTRKYIMIKKDELYL